MLKKGATPAMDAAPCCFIQDSPTLRDLNGLGDLLLRLGLRHGDGQVALVVDADSAIFFLNAWSCKFHGVGLLTLLDIDCRCCTVGTFEAPC